MSEIQLTVGEISLSRADFQSLRKPHRNFLSASSVASNDISIFQKLIMLSVPRSEPRDGIVARMELIHHLTFTRNLAARIYEYLLLVERYKKELMRGNVASDAATIEACKILSEEMRISPYFGTAKRLRDRVTSHYDASDYLTYMSGFGEDHEFLSYQHEKSGNSVCFWGEEIGFLGMMGDLSDGQTFDGFLDWIRVQSGLLTSFRQSRMIDIIGTFLPGLQFQIQTVAIDQALTFNAEARLPIVYSNEPTIVPDTSSGTQGS